MPSVDLGKIADRKQDCGRSSSRSDASSKMRALAAAAAAVKPLSLGRSLNNTVISTPSVSTPVHPYPLRAVPDIFLSLRVRCSEHRRRRTKTHQERQDERKPSLLYYKCASKCINIRKPHHAVLADGGAEAVELGVAHQRDVGHHDPLHALFVNRRGKPTSRKIGER